jgi:hypothetical protein
MTRYQEVGLAKVEEGIAWLERLLKQRMQQTRWSDIEGVDTQVKVVVYGHHHAVLDRIHARLLELDERRVSINARGAGRGVVAGKRGSKGSKDSKESLKGGGKMSNAAAGGKESNAGGQESKAGGQEEGKAGGKRGSKDSQEALTEVGNEGREGGKRAKRARGGTERKVGGKGGKEGRKERDVSVASKPTASWHEEEDGEGGVSGAGEIAGMGGQMLPGELRVMRIDGETPTRERVAVVEAFARCRSAAVAIVSVTAGGQGMNPKP